MSDRAGNILLILSSTIMLVLILIYVIEGFIALGVAIDPSTIALIKYLLLRLIIYLILTLAWFIIAIIGKKKGAHLGLGIASTVITGIVLLYTIWFLISGLTKILPFIPDTMTVVGIISFIVITILVNLGVAGGVLKLLAGYSGSA